MKVPNQFPSLPCDERRIAIVGECPGRDENHFGKPFVGASGMFLDDALGTVGLVRARCFVGNVCQEWPGEKRGFDAFDWDGQEVQEGIAQLHADLERFQPTMILCLGNAALHLFKSGNAKPPKKAGAYDWPDKVGDWRGSLFGSSFGEGPELALLHEPVCDTVWPSPLSGAESIPSAASADQFDPGQGNTGNRAAPLKCLATFHPAAVLREFKLQAYMRFDLKRLVVESKTASLELPRREIEIALPGSWSLDHIKLRLSLFLAEKRPLAVDIEGKPGNITSIAFSNEPSKGFVIPFAHINFARVWPKEDETELWRVIKELLENPQVELIAQNGQYDFFTLGWTHEIGCQRWKHDTMLSFWELHAELLKGLDLQASIYTKEPFYKPDKEDGELVFESDEQFWRYNGVDACVTLEVWQKEVAEMHPGQREHYAFNCACLQPVMSMMRRGGAMGRCRSQGGASADAKTGLGIASEDRQRGR